MLANGMDFVNDEAVIGKWSNIGWIEDLDSCTIENINAKSDDFEDLYFLPNGEPYWIFEGWAKDFLLVHYGGDEPILTYRYGILLDLLMKLKNFLWIKRIIISI